MFGTNFRKCREFKGVTQLLVSERTGIAQPTIARYEKNDSTPSVDVAQRLAQAIGVSLDLIMQDDVNDKEISLMVVLEQIRSTIKSKGLTLGKIETLSVIANIIEKGV
ncbi:MAG: helix-turn-helix transcriptional regulator [Cyclobacteriaceae bacterium]|nr:helix-turn-helix transcriptional regulator [Cyclobacteriaceae bacterium]